ncbi:MAG TPA: hypothetical protein O0W95_03020, partial [Methanocorpusculum sp.]|nr:hypothetical protein [Methanocorpusculum sp.]
MIHEVNKAVQGKKNGIKTALLLLVVLIAVSIAFTGAASAGLSVDPPYNTTVYFYEKITGSSGIYKYNDGDEKNKEINLNKMDVFFPGDEATAGSTYYNWTSGSRVSNDKFVVKKLTAEVEMWVHDSAGNKLYRVSGTDREIPHDAYVSFDVSTNIES